MLAAPVLAFDHHQQGKGDEGMHKSGLQSTLTGRESEILELIADGLSAKETAQSIGIAPRTVERHIENLRLKMRARNRVHLVVRAISEGALQIGPVNATSIPEQSVFAWGDA